MLFSSSTKTKKNYIIFCCTDAFVSKERVKRIVLQILKRSDRQDPWSDVFVKPNPKLWRFGLLIGVLAPKRKKIIYLLLNRCVSLQRKSETHCFTATKAIGPTSPVVRCFCEAESEIVVFRVADQCSSTKTQKIIYLLLYTDAFLSNERVKSIVFHPLKRSDRHDPWSDVVLKLNPKLLCFGLLIGGLAPKPKNLHIFCCTDAFLSKERVKRIVFQPLK